MNKTIKEAFCKRGIYGVIQYCFQRLIGIPEIEEKIDALHRKGLKSPTHTK